MFGKFLKIIALLPQLMEAHICNWASGIVHPRPFLVCEEELALCTIVRHVSLCPSVQGPPPSSAKSTWHRQSCQKLSSRYHQTGRCPSWHCHHPRLHRANSKLGPYPPEHLWLPHSSPKIMAEEASSPSFLILFSSLRYDCHAVPCRSSAPHLGAGLWDGSSHTSKAQWSFSPSLTRALFLNQAASSFLFLLG